MAELNLENQLGPRLRSLIDSGVGWMAPVPELSIMAAQPDLFSSQSGSGEIPELTSPDTIENRRIALDVLANEVKECHRCPELASTRTQTVFGVGPVGADIMFIGEAPGGDEDRQGIPFVGVAGQLLNRIIVACGLHREEVFICNILRCRPPGNRDPKPDECGNCREYLEKTIEIVRPKIICCWGGVAAKNLLKSQKGITSLRGQFYDHNGIPVICTFHPASLLEGRSPQNKPLVWQDMKTMLTKIGKPIPPVKKKDE